MRSTLWSINALSSKRKLAISSWKTRRVEIFERTHAGTLSLLEILQSFIKYSILCNIFANFAANITIGFRQQTLVASNIFSRTLAQKLHFTSISPGHEVMSSKMLSSLEVRYIMSDCCNTEAEILDYYIYIHSSISLVCRDMLLPTFSERSVYLYV